MSDKELERLSEYIFLDQETPTRPEFIDRCLDAARLPKQKVEYGDGTSEVVGSGEWAFDSEEIREFMLWQLALTKFED
jgi:lysine/ornithine N-monooxygenase